MISVPEYRPLTPEGAQSVAKQFGVIDRADAIFKHVTRATEAYRRYRQMPNYLQTKDALQKLSKSFGEVATFVDKRQRILEPRLYGSLSRMLGEDLTYGGLKRLIGEQHVLVPLGKIEIDEYDERTKLDRSLIAAEAGPRLLVSLFQQMRTSVEASLASMAPQARGPRLNVFRHYLIMELADLYAWLFDERPTSTMTGRKSKRRLFSEFCIAIFEEMEIDLTGLRDALSRALKQAGYLKEKSINKRNPRNSGQ